MNLLKYFAKEEKNRLFEESQILFIKLLILISHILVNVESLNVYFGENLEYEYKYK